MIIIPDKLRRPAEVERDELRKHLAEAQAEIENLKWRINSEKAKAEAALELNGKAIELFNEARTDSERKNEELDMFLAEQQAINEIIERKSALIEQMREALKEINSECGAANFSSFDQIKHAVIVSIELSDAALAAERGEG